MMLAGKLLLPLLCALLVPVALARHLPNPESSSLNMRIRKTTKSQKSKAGVADIRQPHLGFRQAPGAEVTASEFGSAVLECEAGGNPPPTIHWLKDGKRLSLGVKAPGLDGTDEETSVEAPLGLSLTRSRLYLDCLTTGDEATYSCVAENPYLRIASDTKLTIKPTSLIRDEGGATSELCLSKKAFGSPARIHMWTHSRLEVQGSDALLFCRTFGLPQPSVLWVGPDERPISSGGKYQVLPSGDLLIRDLVWEDQGSYWCLAENERGTDKTSTFLYPAARERRD